jgi:GT2 family glycosyltransferase/glycosyltransferase involved in cell wall biosynthesis
MSGPELTVALTALAPQTVILGRAPAPLLLPVATWAADRPGVMLTRSRTGAGPRTLLVTADAADAGAALTAGAAVLHPAGLGVRAPDGWIRQDAAGLVLVRRPPAPGPSQSRTTGEQPVAVIVPIHNAAGELQRCLAALSRHTTMPAELVLIDDASTDPAVAAILADVAAWPSARILRNSHNMGFTATVNRALRATAGDVVILNSDTEVGPRWLERLHAAAHRDPRTGTATAVSDNAGAFSVPHIGQANTTPAHLDAASVARLVARAAGDALVPTPTANGFCMYVRRAMLDDVGLFDEVAYPRGYGEENDLSMRAAARGWGHVVDPGTFVRHVREASFGAEKVALADAGRQALDRRHPGYTAAVRAFVADPDMAAARARIDAAFTAGPAAPPRVLFVIQEGGGGTPVANLELMRGLAGRVDCLLLTSDRLRLRLDHVVDGERTPLQEWVLEDGPTRVMDFTREDYRRIVTGVLRDHAVDLVHVRHLFKHTFDVPVVAGRLGIPVVFSFHDFYFACPTVNLLDDHDRYCAGECTDGLGACRVPPAGLDGLPPLKHAYVHQWREEVQAMLAGVDAFVTTSAHARDVHRRALPGIGNRPFGVIPHGRTLTQAHDVNVAPAPGGPVRILVTGNLEVHKGPDYLREILQADRSGRLQLHFLGDVPERYADLGVQHGRFRAGELHERAAAIAPAMIGLFSICAETFSHALTEAWALGVPVIATDLGAFGERLRSHGGGWLIPPDDAEEALRRILAAADDPEAYRTQAQRADLRGCAEVPEMTDAYVALYAEVLDARRSLAPPAGSASGPAVTGRGTRRITAIVAGAGGLHPGSAYVRVVQPLRHPAVAWRLPSRLRYAAQGTLPDDAEVVLVQRTAVPPDQIPSLLADIDRRGVPLVLDLDDHLLLKGALDVEYGAHQSALLELLRAATLVTVSTPELAAELTQVTRDVVIVPNRIDERLFAIGARPPARQRPRRGAPQRILYAGSPSHAADLALLEPVFAELERRAPGRFVLDVVGIQPRHEDQPWIRRLVVPDECKPYPAFVPWLRAQAGRWAAGVAPLADTPFNACKSDLKWLEYTGLGLPTVASDLEPYRSIEDRATGLLLRGDDSVAWADALQEIVDDGAFADTLVDQAWGVVTADRLLRDGSDALANLLLTVARA